MLEVVYFFFQAEDGIRDVAVTGVQTCALPILPQAENCARRLIELAPFRESGYRILMEALERRGNVAERSEERRVGKECRSRWSTNHQKTKKKTTKIRVKLHR